MPYYVQLAKTNNTLILPATCNDVTQMVGQAMTIYKSLAQKNDEHQNGPNNSQTRPAEERTSDHHAEYYSDDEDKPKH